MELSCNGEFTQQRPPQHRICRPIQYPRMDILVYDGMDWHASFCPWLRTPNHVNDTTKATEIRTYIVDLHLLAHSVSRLSQMDNSTYLHLQRVPAKKPSIQLFQSPLTTTMAISNTLFARHKKTRRQ